MKATIISSPFGILSFNKENELIKKELFSKKQPEKAAESLMTLSAGKIPKELEKIIDKLKKSGYDTFVFENENLAEEVKEKLGVTVEVSHPSIAGELFRSDLEKSGENLKLAKNTEALRRWVRSINMEISKLRVKRAVEKKDLLVVKTIQTLDDLDKTINLLMNHLREWYGIHFPEFDKLLDKHETYARLVIDLGNKDDFTSEKLQKEGIPELKARQIIKAAENSMGADLTKTDLIQIQNLSKSLLKLYNLRQNLEKYLEITMEKIGINIKALTGSLLGARLIALAGGITKLAKMPASTLQVLGAEKALFRSLKTGSRPPKHGIIFQHPLIHEAKKWQRGKIARALAGKLTIAARADAFGRRYIGDELKTSLDNRIEEIREKYSQPSKIKKVQPKKPRKPRKQKKRTKKKHARKN